MKRIVEQAGQIDLQRIIVNDIELTRKMVTQFRQCGQTTTVAFHRSHAGPCLQ